MNVEAVSQLAVGDPAASRTVYGVVIALGLIGVALVVLAAWLIRSTRPEPELLAPLERMNDRSWRNQDPAQRRRTLDEVRPEGANPVSPEKKRPVLDAEFDQTMPALGRFDDLQAQERAYQHRSAGEPDVPGSVAPNEPADTESTNSGSSDEDPAIGPPAPGSEAVTADSVAADEDTSRTTEDTVGDTTDDTVDDATDDTGGESRGDTTGDTTGTSRHG